jgi:hypothetical protein
LIIGGTMSTGVERTVSVAGRYCSSSNESVRSTTEPGETPRVSPTWKAERSTMLGTRGGDARSDARLRAPRTKLRPPVSTAVLSACGLASGRFDGASASMRFSAMKPTRSALAQSSCASPTSARAVALLAR